MEKEMSFRDYINQINIDKESVITIGNFDGLHKGHIQLIEETVRTAKQNNLEPIVFTYDVHPKNVLYKKMIHLIMNREDKISILNKYGIKNIIFAPFDKDLQSFTSEKFCKEILINKLKMKVLVLGEDARFGSEMKEAKEISKEFLDENSIDLKLIPLLKEDDNTISSSLIRNLIEEGKIEQANSYLGRYFKISGKVVHGFKRGSSKLGFPTANIGIDENQILAKKGVYATIVKYEGKTYKGATNVGNNPTFSDGNKLSIETYILDFNKKIYDKDIELYFVKRIRDELKFSSVEELIEQMKSDVINTDKIITEAILEEL